MSDVAYEAFAQAEVRRLDELRLSAIEARLDAELELGRHAALIGELEALAASEPTRELVAGQLALALYRSGRQADALEALRRTRVRDARGPRARPGAALRRLQDQILRQDPALVPVKRTPLPDELDAALATQLHGRERELAELRGCLVEGAAPGAAEWS